MTYYTGAKLGASKTGLAIGYRLVAGSGTVTQAFTTTNVAETTIPGNYHVTTGITISAGWNGRIIWGISGTDYAEEFISAGITTEPGNGVSGPFSGCE